MLILTEQFSGAKVRKIFHLAKCLPKKMQNIEIRAFSNAI
jgi:hypothetical protein